MAAWVADQKRDELAPEGQDLLIPVFQMQNMQEVVESDQYRERDFLVEIDHPATGPPTYPGAPLKFSATLGQVRSPAPQLGRHNAEVYGKLLGLRGLNILRNGK